MSGTHGSARAKWACMIFFFVFLSPTWGFCGTGTYYLTSYNQYDGTKIRLAKDVHCLAAFGEEGGN